MNLSNLHPAEGSKHSDSFRRGRGHASGNGKTAGKGHKGQKARSGAPRPGFEGGQMPLYRRLPKRGFTNINSKEIVGINVSVLERFENDSVVSPDIAVIFEKKSFTAKADCHCTGLEKSQANGKISGVLCDLLSSVLTILLHFLKFRNCNGKQLHDDGRCDIRGDAQRKDRHGGERSSCDRIEKSHSR